MILLLSLIRIFNLEREDSEEPSSCVKSLIRLSEKLQWLTNLVQDMFQKEKVFQKKPTCYKTKVESVGYPVSQREGVGFWFAVF